MAVEVQRRLFTMEEFARLADAGILAEDERIEFLDGELIALSIVGGRHVRSLMRFDRAARVAAGENFDISVQNPLRIGDRASFLPDLAVLRADATSNDVPSAEEAILVVEIADSSRNYDRFTKFPRYATAGIPEAWFVDLVEDRIERHTEPGENGYGQVAWAGRGEHLSSTVLPGLTIDVDAILGPRPEDKAD
jgi:Uma2 family endonuclease